MSQNLLIRRSPALVGGSWASFSPDEAYRYDLVLRWIMLNPSTATREQTDATLGRCRLRAIQLGYPGILVQNLFALRATKPAATKRHPNPIGPNNDERLVPPAEPVATTVAAWGIHGTHRGRDTEVLDLLTGPLQCLGRTAAGQPRHPLFVSWTTPLIDFRVATSPRELAS
jgi:hypothetical protein